MLLTIITVVKNDKNNIIKTIKSVQKQKYKKYEHIIIDGKSNDGTSGLISIEAKKNKKIKFFIKQDKNLYEALNFAIKVSSGEIIAILHSGDIFHNDKVTNFYVNNAKRYDVICGNVLFLNKNKITRRWNYQIDKLNIMNAFKIAHTSLVIKRSLFRLIGSYNTSYSISSDTDFILKMSSIKKIRFKYFNKNFVIMSTGGLSSSFENFFIKFKEDLHIYKNYFKEKFILIYLYKLSYKFIKLIL